jgi:RNA polymerase sigma-70 factor, ECF subfamily
MRPRDPFADPERLIRRVYAYVAYRIGEGADAEDVTAEAIERALKYKDSYDDAKGEAVAWVIGIARRVLMSHPVREQAAVLDDEISGSDEVEETAVRRVSVRSAVEHLSDRDQELVALRYGADLSAREIGLLLEMKTNAVEVALHRVIERLRNELATGPTVRPRPVVQSASD